MASGSDLSCHECGKALKNQFIEAGRCHYHPDCVKYRHCRKTLHPLNIYVINNGPYCGNHRGADVGVNEKCPECQKNFRAANFVEQITVAGVAYHNECIKCATCKKDVEPDQWQAHENALYCNECYDSKHPKKCQTCKKKNGDQDETIVPDKFARYEIQIVIHQGKGYDDVLIHTLKPADDDSRNDIEGRKDNSNRDAASSGTQ